jgi:hydrogenase maturation factor
LSASTLRNAKNFYRQISVVKDALTAYKTGGVHAMHDPTEGGVAGGIHEMADASGLGVKIFEKAIPVQPETAKICSHFEIDPLQLISSGALLISAEAKSTDKIIRNLKQQQIAASVIGEFLEDPDQRLLIRENGAAQAFPRPSSDHLWTALKK